MHDTDQDQAGPDDAGRRAAHARRIADNLLLSCEAERLYGQGGFPGEPALLAALSDRVSRHTRVLGEVFPGHPAADPGHPRLYGGTAAFRAGQGARLSARRPPVPPTLLLESRDVRLAGNALYVVEDGEPRVLFETYRPQDRHVVAGPGPDFEAVDEAVPEEGFAVLINSAGSFNYGHWLIDDLPRLRAVAMLRARHPDVPITVLLMAYVPHVDAARRGSVTLVLGDLRGVTVRFLDPSRTYRFARLHHPSPSSLPIDRKSPEAIRYLGRRVRRRMLLPRWLDRARRIGQGGRGGRRLFVDRHPGRGRMLANRAEVMALLASHGFEAFDPEVVSVRQQAIRFGQAEFVVGIAGAAMANTVFCAPGTPLVYLVPEGWEDPFYWEVATACGHGYGAVFGPRHASDGPEDLQDFTVAVDDLAAALAASGL
ncbi:glycosyltransferase family 61 protein [Methylobacterium sp. Leaf118]|uniref:glycosyltransferase family 61 protein n=1 Tax=Methylobacterium sp. Leaf118 TaxID=2876562 RepID=UPI001E2C4556|nr:glycosyltransferase family 61 protein [Methylobacterium sp. Leaf118]